jgi:hypothetical protein
MLDFVFCLHVQSFVNAKRAIKVFWVARPLTHCVATQIAKDCPIHAVIADSARDYYSGVFDFSQDIPPFS